MLKAIIFDLGGTLMAFGDPEIDYRTMSKIGLAALHTHLLRQDSQALPPLPVFQEALDDVMERAWEESAQTLRSARLDTLLARALPSWGITASPTALEAMIRVYHQGMQRWVRLYDDTLATLELARQRGLKIGLISNTIWLPEMHDADLKRLGIAGFFDHRVYSSAFPYVKPHPAIFEHSLAALGVAPEEALFVGDRIVDDIGGALGAGLRAVHKLPPPSEEAGEAETSAGDMVPEAVIRTLTELWDIMAS